MLQRTSLPFQTILSFQTILYHSKLSAPQFFHTNEALEFPSAGGIGPTSVHPVMEEVPLDAAPEKSPEDESEAEPKADSGMMTSRNVRTS